MDLREAYRVLEIAPGATRDQAREARNVLAKVWHPDKHHGDPKLQDRAAEKLRQVNDAYKTLETAQFPPPPRDEPKRREAPPAYVDSINKPRPQPTPPKVKADIEFVPRRRIRMWVPFVLGLAVAGGIAFYLRPGSEAAPIANGERPDPSKPGGGSADPAKPASSDPSKPGSDPSKPTDPSKPGSDPSKPGGSDPGGSDPTRPGSSDPTKSGADPTKPDPSKPGTDPTKPDPAKPDPEPDPTKPGSDPAKPDPAKDRFTLGSTRDDVRRVMGTPTNIDNVFERYYYGTAYVEFRDDKVSGWTAMGFDKLKTTLAPKDPAVAAAAAARGTYTEHATRDEVLGVEGPPETIERDFGFGERWYYSMSYVSFDKTGHINEIWRTPTHKLKLE
ncbi:MAG: DnaJ domain-containing protein [Kofleriaceae bacterium]